MKSVRLYYNICINGKVTFPFSNVTTVMNVDTTGGEV